MPSPIPVVCDRCRAEGVAGEEAFADFGDLLDFEPVPRRPRADGWTPELQRAFIAALAVTGSPRRAARAVGKAQFGAGQLRKANGAEGFNAAWDRAMALAAEKGRHRLSAGFDAIVREDSQILPGTGRGSEHARQAGGLPTAQPDAEHRYGRSMVEGPAHGADEAEGDQELTEAAERAGLEMIAAIVHKYLLKLEAERRCRLDGRIAEADFYLRQVTMLEVALDVASGDGMKVLTEARLGGHDLLHIAETELSKLLDGYCRKHWQECGDPPRPEYPPRHLLVEHDGFSTEPLECTHGGVALSHNEQLGVFAERHAADAAAHIAWEAEARRDYDRRRDSAAGHRRRAVPGRPACDLKVDRTDVTNSVRDGPAPEEPPASASDGDSCARLSPHKETEK